MTVPWFAAYFVDSGVLKGFVSRYFEKFVKNHVFLILEIKHASKK
jgi:hypothetical protein